MSPGGKATEETRFRFKEESMYESRQKGGGRVSFLQGLLGKWQQRGRICAGRLACAIHIRGDREPARRGSRRERGIEGHTHGAPS